MSRFTSEIIRHDPKVEYAMGFRSSPEGSKANAVDEFYCLHAWHHHQLRSVRTYSFIDAELPDTIGFFSLSCRSVLNDDTVAIAEVKDKALRFEFIFETREKDWAIFPSIYINYLCINHKYQGKFVDKTEFKYRDFFFKEILNRTSAIAHDIGALYVELDALDARVSRIYEELGFRKAFYHDDPSNEDVSFDDLNRLPKYILPISSLWKHDEKNSSIHNFTTT